MRTVSPRFSRTVRGSHTMIVRATVCSGFQHGTQPSGERIPVIGGDVTHDGTAQIRSTLDLTTDGSGMWPRDPTSLLAPYGNEIYVERGIRYGLGDEEFVGQGYFRIQSPGQTVVPDGPIRIVGQDRMGGLIESRLLFPHQFDAGTTYGTIVSTLVQMVYPTAVIEWDDYLSGAIILKSAICSQDRYKFIDDLVKTVGKIWYWDYRGVLVIRSPAEVALPVADISAGEDGVLIGLEREVTRDGVFNAILATGEGTDDSDPVIGLAFDDNPISPTYFFGQFGQVTDFFNSSFLATDGQAATAAAAILSRSLGAPYSADLTTVPHPGLEPYDPVVVGTSESVDVHVLERVTVPLSQSEPMRIGTKEKRNVIIRTQL